MCAVDDVFFAVFLNTIRRLRSVFNPAHSFATGSKHSTGLSFFSAVTTCIVSSDYLF